MRLFLGWLATFFFVAGFIGCIPIWIEAFQEELWKGLLSFCCFFYLIYYGLVEFEHQYKWPIVAIAFGSPGIGFAVFGLIK